MNTPVASKKQQQKKLSAKKGLRNVLAQPYEKYWPVLGKDEESSLEELLNRLLPGLKRQSNAIPWAQLRKMEKEERLTAQKKARTESQAKADENSILKAVTMGVNAVTRDLEKNNASSVLLDSSAESLLVKHVVVMAQNKGVPILLVPFLKNVTLQNIGFASAAMGLKNYVTEIDHPFHEIHQEIVRCSPPSSTAQKVLINESGEVSDEDSPKDERMSVEVENLPSEVPFTLSANVYKFRTSRNERIFVPPGTAKKLASDKGWSDFIAIGNVDTEMDVEKVAIPRKKQRYMDIHAKREEKTSPVGDSEFDGYIAFGSKNDETSTQGSKYKGKKKSTPYLPLKVKRIQGNNNRVKATKAPKQKKKSSSNKG